MRIEDLIGRRLGRYEILEVLGRGGMAAVYRARDTVLRRDVALKILYPQYTGDTALVERFQREAVLAAGLDHPNILPIYDVGEADGLIYIAMRLLGGRSFADVLRLRGALPPAELIPIVDQIASALDYAHSRNIVHRDIKPANILIEDPLGAAPRAVLTDFGIAKSLDPATTGLTNTGVLIGTPDYMAPEQIRGGHMVDGRADIYALGVLVYRALTGRRPFDGGTQEVLLGHLQGQLADPSALEPALPRALDPVVRRALARDPAQRYRSAGEFARALRAVLALDSDTPPPAARRDGDGRAVVPRVAIDDIARQQAGGDARMTLGQATARGDAAPPYARVAHARPATPARDIPAAYYPERPARRGGAALIVVGLLLVGLIGGGLLYAASVLPAGGSTGAVTLPTTAAPAPTALPTEQPSAAPTDEPSAAPTTAPTAAPTTAATAAPAPTAAPTSAPTSVPAPTSTPRPSPTATPTQTPSPTVDPLTLMTGGFGALYQQSQTVRERLGNPLERESGGKDQVSEQLFDNGSMFYFLPLDRIYVLMGTDDGSWLGFDRDVVGQFPEPTPASPPPCPELIRGGFARIWANQTTIREKLGCSAKLETGLIEGAYQPFENGVMLFSQEGLGRGKSIYVLYADGTFQRFDDPNR